jgi:hypothetical protein
VPDAFYEPDDGGFIATEATRGPWDPDAQHASPPAALIGREIERLGGGRMGGGEGPPAQVGRLTYEIVRSVPIGPVRVSAEVTRPGRRVELVEALLTDSEGTELIRARGWRLRSERVDFDQPRGFPGPPPGPDGMKQEPFFETGSDVGYHTSMEYGFAAGAFQEPGPATAWLRMGVDLVAGERPTPLQRLLAAADTGNGISAALDWRRYVFINVDLTVHIHRLPEGEWVCLDAITLPERTGIGMADTRLFDERGSLGRAVQTLLVAQR